LSDSVMRGAGGLEDARAHHLADAQRLARVAHVAVGDLGGCGSGPRGRGRGRRTRRSSSRSRSRPRRRESRVEASPDRSRRRAGAASKLRGRGSRPGKESSRIRSRQVASSTPKSTRRRPLVAPGRPSVSSGTPPVASSTRRARSYCSGCRLVASRRLGRAGHAQDATALVHCASWSRDPSCAAPRALDRLGRAAARRLLRGGDGR
jgi:hypothetical protein